MAKNIQAVRGMNDLLPESTPVWQTVEAVLRQVVASYGYSEVRLPLVESTDLFKRTIGEVTDIVEKEMYTFEDRNGDSLTLRPEGTAGCVRAGIEKGLLYNQIQRLWYMGPMFRHERPQKGRYRQFNQFGVEVYGLQGPDIDAEVIMMSHRFWALLGLNSADEISLELNNLGSSEARAHYKAVLVEYMNDHIDRLDEHSIKRLEGNPLRILDSKNPEMKSLINHAPILTDYLDSESADHYEGLKDRLDVAGIHYTMNPRLVRGLDYYNGTVFEWVTTCLGSQSAVCAGGRYDGLVDQLGGKPTPAFGFAMGLERLIEILKVNNKVSENKPLDVFFISVGDEANKNGLMICEELRRKLEGVVVQFNCGGGALKKQLKRANASGAQIAVILGDEEMVKGNILIKYLREKREQQLIPQQNLVDFLRNALEA